MKKSIKIFLLVLLAGCDNSTAPDDNLYIHDFQEHFIFDTFNDSISVILQERYLDAKDSTLIIEIENSDILTDQFKLILDIHGKTYQTDIKSEKAIIVESPNLYLWYAYLGTSENLPNFDLGGKARIETSPIIQYFSIKKALVVKPRKVKIEVTRKWKSF